MFKFSPDKEYQTCSTSLRIKSQTWYLYIQFYTLLINYLAVTVHYSFQKHVKKFPLLLNTSARQLFTLIIDKTSCASGANSWERGGESLVLVLVDK